MIEINAISKQTVKEVTESILKILKVKIEAVDNGVLIQALLILHNATVAQPVNISNNTFNGNH
jgi:hypothetical protein